jgi:hypothetical protein
MPCFVLKDGTTVRSQTTPSQYRKYIRLIEKGYNTEEAFAEATKKTAKDYEELRVEAFTQMTPKLRKSLIGRIYRTKCTFAEAYLWAKETGRAWKDAETAKKMMEILK